MLHMIWLLVENIYLTTVTQTAGSCLSVLMPFFTLSLLSTWSLSFIFPCLAVSLIYTLLHSFLCFFSFSPLHLVDTVSFGLLVNLLPFVTFCTATHLCFVTWADVAHHRAQHALNKPSNSKAPQGTSLSATLLTPAKDASHCRPTACQTGPQSL